ncbi:Ima1 N-terminal domain-containing protein [Ganoderma leucocontextum]|nr:Ima1 N-terminal domain-containing protein [Ganoderma leucocontextum]
MSGLFKQPSAVFCFYCQSGVTPIPRNPRLFQCPHCDCWNSYNAKGEIVSDDPAMHEENCNTSSFARRASPRKDRLPSTHGNTSFCHTCQTNQVLLQNLLANYLPPPDDSDYEKRLELLPEYQRSIEIRYPPVCANCLPTIEQEIKKKDEMARVRALGSALRSTRGTDNRRRTPATTKDREKLDRELWVWRIRGCLWAASVGCALAGHASIAASYRYVSLPGFFPSVLLGLVVVSIFWTAWDPTYATVRRYQFQGRVVRVHGKTQYSALQLVIWLTRLATAVLLALPRLRPNLDTIHLWTNPLAPPARIYSTTMLVCEGAALLTCAFLLKVQHPPPVRLVGSQGHLHRLSATPSVSSSRDGTPIVPEPDMFSALSLSNNPVLGASVQNPIFGVPSLPTAGPQLSPPRPAPRSPGMDMDMDDDDERDPDAMDIDPASPAKKPSNNDDGSWLRPQRFFAPEEPTGLENLFARTIRLVDSSEQNGHGASSASMGGRKSSSSRRAGKLLCDWRIWLTLSIVPLFAVGYKAWDVYGKKNAMDSST